MITLGLDNTYRRLPPRFYAEVEPAHVAAPRLIAFNRPLARELGLDDAVEANAAALFSGTTLAADAQPIALAYAGHQFGNFVPQLGDGRALLLGERIDTTGARRDIQLKGSGPTPFSRRGDGRAALGPVLREYIVSEAMHALGIPTTRSLAAVATGETVRREEMLPGAVLTRIAASHIRIGTFQYFAARQDREARKQLADYVIDRHYPELARAPNRYLALIEAVAARQALLVARWMHVGFIHGVMNTDNMTVSGETIDYGPCAFLDAYDPAKVFSSIDHGGRYAFANQPAIAQWNLARFAETLLDLIDSDTTAAIAAATPVIEAFAQSFEQHWLHGMRAKLGLSNEEPGDASLIQELLNAMHEGNADYTLTFRRLCDAALDARADEDVRALFANPTTFDTWAANWRPRLTRDAQIPTNRAQAMRGTNPTIIPRNHRIEQAITAAEQGDFSAFERLTTALAHPFKDNTTDLTLPPKPDERVAQTFCGT
ncbi:MAG: YdiU family protein [Alphaproteobacteria bacterium]|nr:YdiU family protein [Alphaproteobacteria bacterium]